MRDAACVHGTAPPVVNGELFHMLHGWPHEVPDRVLRDRSVRRQISQRTNKTAQQRFLLIVDLFVSITLSTLFHSGACYTFSFLHGPGRTCAQPVQTEPDQKSAQRIVLLRQYPSLSVPGTTTASLLVSKWLRSVVSTLPSPSGDASTKKSSP